jgi:hypothetical protein
MLCALPRQAFRERSSQTAQIVPLYVAESRVPEDWNANDADGTEELRAAEG